MSAEDMILFQKKLDEKEFLKIINMIFQKYIEFTIKELGCKFKNESEIKKILPKNSNVVDFYIEESNIFVECKAIEIQAYTSINPTEERLYSSLKDSLLKTYFKQLINVAKTLNPKEENWGIILTYKELFGEISPTSSETRKQFFNMHLDIYDIQSTNLSYLSKEGGHLNF